MSTFCQIAVVSIPLLTLPIALTGHRKPVAVTPDVVPAIERVVMLTEVIADDVTRLWIDVATSPSPLSPEP
jgi:hypothetical protein